jgi:hypothetical protein
MASAFRNFIRGIAIGTGTMYYLDPKDGKRRRIQVGEKVRRMNRESREFMEAALDDLRNRAEGLRHAGMRFGERQKRSQKLIRENWLPGTRLLVGIGGGLFLARGLSRRGLIGFIYSLLGSTAIIRAYTNAPLQKTLSEAEKQQREVISEVSAAVSAASR